MSELSRALGILSGNFPTCVQRVDYPMHQGKPNPKHGKFYFVGSIPRACYDLERGGSMFYDSEDDAITAAIEAGATRIQRVNCEFVNIDEFKDAHFDQREEDDAIYNRMLGRSLGLR